MSPLCALPTSKPRVTKRGVRSGGTALTTLDVADTDALAARGVAGVNFRSIGLLSRALPEQLSDAVVTGRIVVPPIAQVGLDDVPKLNGKAGVDGKTVITL
jgi:hypothetical protein